MWNLGVGGIESCGIFGDPPPDPCPAMVKEGDDQASSPLLLGKYCPD